MCQSILDESAGCLCPQWIFQGKEVPNLANHCRVKLPLPQWGSELLVPLVPRYWDPATQWPWPRHSRCQKWSAYLWVRVGITQGSGLQVMWGFLNELLRLLETTGGRWRPCTVPGVAQPPQKAARVASRVAECSFTDVGQLRVSSCTPSRQSLWISFHVIETPYVSLVLGLLPLKPHNAWIYWSLGNIVSWSTYCHVSCPQSALHPPVESSLTADLPALSKVPEIYHNLEIFSQQQVFSLPPTVRLTSYLVYHFPAVGFLICQSRNKTWKMTSMICWQLE